MHRLQCWHCHHSQHPPSPAPVRPRPQPVPHRAHHQPPTTRHQPWPPHPLCPAQPLDVCTRRGYHSLDVFATPRSRCRPPPSHPPRRHPSPALVAPRPPTTRPPRDSAPKSPPLPAPSRPSAENPGLPPPHGPVRPSPHSPSRRCQSAKKTGPSYLSPARPLWGRAGER